MRILLPVDGSEHSERVARNAQLSWTSEPVEAESPWLRMFRNARVWVD